MRWTFRKRLQAIVALTAFSLTATVIFDLLSMRQVDRQLAEVESEYVPLLDLGPAVVTAFQRVRRIQTFASAVRMLVPIVLIIVVATLALGISRKVIRAQAELSAGFERFGRGDFSRPIRMPGQDELVETASHANRMAAN